MKKILVADDVKDMRELLSAILESKGYETLTAETGDQVVKMVETNADIALVLLDIGMPGVDGLQATKTILAKQTENPIKVCFVSGSRDRVTVQKALASGGHDYVIKPIDPVVLLQKVQKLLGDAQLVNPQDVKPIKTRMKGKFWNLPLMMDFNITQISEIGMIIESQIPFKAGGRFDLEIPYLGKVLGVSPQFSCLIDKIEKFKQLHIMECSFQGMPEAVREKIRNFALTKAELIES